MSSDDTRYRGAIQIEGPDFLKGKRKFATTVHSVRELTEAIQEELEALHLKGTAIADQPFTVQWYSEAYYVWKEVDDLAILEVVSGNVRLIPVGSDGPIKSQDDWDFSKVRKREQMSRGRKASYIPNLNAVRQGAMNRLEYDWTSEASDNGRQNKVNSVIDEFRQRDREEPSKADPPGIFLWRFKISIKHGSCCWLTCCITKFLCPCCFSHYKPIAAYIFSHNGEYEDVQRCIRKGQDINECDAQGRSPLSVAVMEEHSDIMELLIHNGVDVDKGDTMTGLTPLHHAVAQARAKYVDRLLVAGCNINAGDKKGMTSLMLAAQEGELEIVAMLVQEAKYPEDESRRGLEVVDVRDDSRWTSLHYAAHRGELEIAEYLLEEGDANQHTKDRNGFTASEIAFQEGFGELAAFLDSKNSHLHSAYDSKK